MRFPKRSSLRSAILVLTICLLAFSTGIAGAAPDSQTPQPAAASADILPYVPGEVVIGWQPEPRANPNVRGARLDVDRASAAWQQAVASLAARTGLKVLDAQPDYGTARLAVSPGSEAAAIQRLSALPWVKFAEPNYIAHAAGYPNDPYIGEQWNMRRIGAPAAWDLTFGSYSLVVAVIDSGIDFGHPEFTGRLLVGHNYVNPYVSPNDDNGHGTHVTGILAAAANNGIGVAGLAANVHILPLKVLNAQGAGTYENISTAIYYATDYGAQVINLSLGGLSDSYNLSQAIAYARSHNVFVAAAAGNCGQSAIECGYVINPNFYPAAYSGVVAVGATDHDDNWASYSGYKSYIALSAPGGVAWDAILSTLPGNSYGVEYGTSMATPLVSAAAALVLTYMPAATASQVADILKNTADKVGPYTYVGGHNDWFGAGRLNVAKAVRWAYPPTLNPITTPQSLLMAAPVAPTALTFQLTNPSDQPITWQAVVLQGGSWLRLISTGGTATYSTPGHLTAQVGPASLAPGDYSGVIQVSTLSPTSVQFPVLVTLKVVASLNRTYLPLTTGQNRASVWVDPSVGGIPVYPTAETPARIGLPFPVTFYGNTYSAISISFKGYASFSQLGSGTAVAQNTCLPTASLPNDAIYALWQDWNPALGGQVYVQQPDSGRFVVTWLGVRRLATDLPQSFQMILGRDGSILLQYLSVQSPTLGTVGIENLDGSVAQQIACQGAGRPPIDGDTLALSAVLPW